MFGGEHGGERTGFVAHVAGFIDEVCAEEEDVCVLGGECGACVCVDGDAAFILAGVCLDEGGEAACGGDAFEEGAGFEDVYVQRTRS